MKVELTEDVVREVIEDYTPEDPPPCVVCGDKLTIAQSGPEGTKFACSPWYWDEEGVRHEKEGRHPPFGKESRDHYRESGWWDLSRHDSRVLALAGAWLARTTEEEE